MEWIKVTLLFIVTLIPAVITDQLQEELFENGSTNTGCPPWAQQDQNGACRCAQKLLICDKKSWTVSLPICYCFTQYADSNITALGTCLFTCLIGGKNHELKDTYSKYRYKIDLEHKRNTSAAINWCDMLQMNRTGQMCGRCKEGYALPVYSYSLACVKCSDYKYNWLKYIAVAFLPLTLFYMVVLLFRISATSGAMHSYVLFSQLLTAPSLVRQQLINCKIGSTILSWMVGFHMIWNLDFFRQVPKTPLHNQFCLHPNMSTLQTLSLDYIIAVYPLGLILITYAIVHLHDNNPMVVRLWRPFYKCFVLFRKQWDIKANLVDVFATFLLLSYTKILNVSFDLLIPTTLYNVRGRALPTRYLYYNGTVEYFGPDHLPFALLAIVMILVFNILPLLLLSLHPCRCFQRCLKTGFCQRQRLALEHFIDAFQGEFKTEPRDYRYYSAIYLFIRIFYLALFCSTTGISFFLPLAGLVIGGITLSIAITKPYKQPAHNTINLVILSLLIIALFYEPAEAYMNIRNTHSYSRRIYRLIYGGVFLATISAINVGYLIHGLIPGNTGTKIRRLIVKVSNIFRKKYRNKSEDEDKPLLPYPLEQSNENTPLLPLTI